MDNQKDAVRAMQIASHELQHLRRENAVLGAKAEVLDIFKAALLGRPGGMAMGEDAVYLLQQAIRGLENTDSVPLAKSA